MTDTAVRQEPAPTSSTALLSSPGFVAIAILAVFTIVEYVLNVTDVPGLDVFLGVIAFAKAAVIITSFMHIKNIFSEDHS